MISIYNILPEVSLLIIVLYFIIYKSYVINLSNDLKMNHIEKIIYITFFSLILILISIYDSNYCIYSFNKLFVNDNLTIFTKIVILVSTLAVLFISKNYLKNNKIYEIEYYIFILLSILGMFTLISSNDFITFYIAIELQSLSFYTLATYRRKSLYSTEAGLKYFILGAISSSLLLFGISILYSFTGATSFNDLHILLYNIDYLNNDYINNLYLLSMILIIVSILFKLGAVPFHNWLPDIYEGSSTSVTAFFSIVPKIALIAIFIKLLMLLVLITNSSFNVILSISCILSITVGSLSALFQKKIKRLLAYSAISHIGYILIGFIGSYSYNYVSILTYIIIYIIMTILVFTVVFTLSRQKESRGLGTSIVHIEYISELKGLAYKEPYLAILLSITFFSMAGIPPLAGFFSKMYILLNAIESNLIIVPLISIIFSVVSAFYYIRLVKLMFFEKDSKIKYMKYKKKIIYFTLVLIVFLTFFLFMPNVLVEFIQILIENLYNIYL